MCSMIMCISLASLIYLWYETYSPVLNKPPLDINTLEATFSAGSARFVPEQSPHDTSSFADAGMVRCRRNVRGAPSVV